MKKLVGLFFVFIAFSDVYSQTLESRQWHQYRGYRSSGVLDDAKLPASWDVKTGHNVVWDVEIPGLGMSSPVIWDDKLFITTAISSEDQEGLKEGIYGDIGSVNDDSEHEWRTYCFNKNTGELLWNQLAHRGVPEQKRHPKSSHANCTAATNGEYLVAFFGSEGLYCYDMDGNELWSKDFGVLKSAFFRVASAEWEFASSPIIYGNKVIIQCDVMEDSFLAAFELATGRELWKQPRDEYPGWCTPNVYVDRGREIIAVNGYKHRGGYDLETGEEIWRMSGGGDIQIPTPIIGNGLVYFNSAHGPSSPILAIDFQASGDITLEEGETSNEFVRWSIPRGGSYMQTMVLYEGMLYNLKWNGQLDCYDAETGEEIYKEKLGRAQSFTASPVISDGQLYAVNDEGIVYIIQCGKDFKIIAENELDDLCLVTPAITEGIIFFRTQNRLVAIGEK
jgi:outer membrane protein assembly factor BamB